MRLYCVFIGCLVLIACCSLARSDFSQSPDRCCFSFTTRMIPVKFVESIHTTHPQCNNYGVIIITKAQKEICADPAAPWVQKLIKLVNNRNMKEISEGSA